MLEVGSMNTIHFVVPPPNHIPPRGFCIIYCFIWCPLEYMPCPLEYLLVPSCVPLPTLGTYLIDNMSLPYVTLSLHNISPKHHLLAAYDNSLTTLSWLSCEATKRDNENGRDKDLWLLVGDTVGKKIMNHLIVKRSDWNPLKNQRGNDGATFIWWRAM